MRKEIAGLFDPRLIEIDPAIRFPDPPEDPGKEDAYKWECKERVLRVVVDVLSRSGAVRNPSKLFRDLLNRERKASTAVGEGVAVPHVRTMQPRELVMCFVRFAEGVEFFSPDGEPVYFVFGIVTPPYDDKRYVTVLKWISRVFAECFWLRDSLMNVKSASEVRDIMAGLASDVHY